MADKKTGKNKKEKAFFTFLILLIVIVLIFIFLKNEDSWICQNGLWIKHGQPSDPKPIGLCGSMKNIIRIDKIKSGDKISTPLEMSGLARGYWFFEGSFPIEILDENRQIIIQGVAEAQKEWMTEDFVPFKIILDFLVEKEQNGFIILKRDNPSDLKENDAQIEIPVILKMPEEMVINVYFNNSNFDPEYSCNLVFPIKRNVIKTKAVARATLIELLKGVTEEEKTQGYFSNINPGVEINELSIDSGVAKVDFNGQLEYQIGGSCRVTAIRSQITETLKQFPTVDEVIISVEGRIEDALQP